MGTSMIVWEETAPESGKIKITVFLTPGSSQQSLKEAWMHKPLQQWK